MTSSDIDESNNITSISNEKLESSQTYLEIYPKKENLIV